GGLKRFFVVFWMINECDIARLHHMDFIDPGGTYVGGTDDSGGSNFGYFIQGYGR
ncbi:MAG: hypothetical protein RL491_234, partial [Bacteroidota bacterium]